MGYRSQVRSLIYGPEDKLNTFLTMQSLILSSPVFRKDGFIDSLSRYSTDVDIWDSETTKYVQTTLHVLDLYGDGWKWYESYPDVQAWEKLLVEAEEFGLTTEFVRIGEEVDDVVRRYSGNSSQLLSVSVSVVDDFEKGECLPLGI